jgi:hypothetical protein
MFEAKHGSGGGYAAAAPVRAPLTTADLRAFLERLPTLDTSVGDAELVEQVGLLESVKHAAAGAQAVATVAFDASRREQQAAAGVPAREQGRGVAAEVALARRDSPARGSRHLGLARALAGELPEAMAHLRAGRVSEWRVTLLARETATLEVEHRREVDRRMAADLPLMGDARVARTARALALRLDPGSRLRRIRGAVADRRVGIRPAPDTMTLLTGFLPVAQGVAAYAALEARASELRSQGDPRSRGQIMADTLVERLTGQSSADAVPLEVQLVMPAETLLGSGDEPAVVGDQPVPAAFARQLVATCGDAGARQWLRRLFTTPDGRALVGAESRRRTFGDGLRRLLVLRDQSCRTPWCDAPVRHADHVVPAARGGPTSLANGQGLCEACNHTKELPGWRHDVVAAGPGMDDLRAGPHRVLVTTPTGRHHHTTAPPVLPSRTGGPDESPSALERHYERLPAA